MSYSKTFNAALALVEGRTRIARDILADPTLNLTTADVVDLQRRLEKAVQTVCIREVIRILKQILVDALRLEPSVKPNTGEDSSSDTVVQTAQQHAFFEGQETLFRLIEARIERLENILNEDVHIPRLPEL